MREPKDKRICKCECGGEVRGIEQFDRLFTWCESCTPTEPLYDPRQAQGYPSKDEA